MIRVCARAAAGVRGGGEDGGPANTRARLNLAAHYALYGYVDKARAELKRAGGVVPNPTGDASEHPELGALKRLTGEVRK